MQKVKFPRNISIRASLDALRSEDDTDEDEDALLVEQGVSTDVVSVESFEEMLQVSSYPNELADEEDRILLDRFLDGEAIEEFANVR